MSKEIRELPCDFCKYDCPSIDLFVDITTLYADGKAVDRVFTLRCENEELCKQLRKELVYPRSKINAV